MVFRMVLICEMFQVKVYLRLVLLFFLVSESRLEAMFICPPHKYQVKLCLSPWNSADYAALIAHINHFSFLSKHNKSSASKVGSSEDY